MAGNEMPPQAPGQAPQGDAGGASQLVVDIQQKMQDLQGLLGKALPEEAQKFSQIMGAYESFVDGLGQAPGAPEPGPAPMKGGPVPMEAGGAKARPVL